VLEHETRMFDVSRADDGRLLRDGASLLRALMQIEAERDSWIVMALRDEGARDRFFANSIALRERRYGMLRRAQARPSVRSGGGGTGGASAVNSTTTTSTSSMSRGSGGSSTVVTPEGSSTTTWYRGASVAGGTGVGGNVVQETRTAPWARRPGEPVVIRFTNVNVHDFTEASRVLVYSANGGRAAIGGGTPRALTDTLRVATLSSLTVDLTDGDVHVVVDGPGTITLSGSSDSGAAVGLSGSGRRIRIYQGGRGLSLAR